MATTSTMTHTLLQWTESSKCLGYTIRVFRDYCQPDLHAGMGHPIDYDDNNTGIAYVLGKRHHPPQERETKAERKRERERECVCVCV